MAYGLSSPLGIAGIILIILGIIMAVIGIILLIANQNKPKGWYIWFLIIVGILAGIAGGIMLAVALMQAPTSCEPPCETVTRTKYIEAAPKVQYVTMEEPAPKVQYVTVEKPAPKVQYVTVEKKEAAPPPASRIIRTEKVGQETFDPDPQTYVYETPQPAERVMAVGPYGPNGTKAQVSGVYKGPVTRYYVTSDIPEHVVTTK